LTLKKDLLIFKTIMKHNSKAGSFGFFPIAAAVTVTGLFLTAQPSCAQTSGVVPIYTVGTYSGGAWNGNYITGFGISNPNTDGTVGQTFSINNVNALIDSIQVPIYGSSLATFQIGVAAWNGSQLTGPMLYLSSPITGVNGWLTYTLNPNNLVLNQNQLYALFVTPNNSVNTSPSYNTGMGYVSSYSGGELYQIAGYELSVNDLFTQGWTGVPAAFAFSMSYQAVPEPSAMALAGLGTLALWLRYRSSIKAGKI
jgi:hypothetical protein